MNAPRLNAPQTARQGFRKAAGTRAAQSAVLTVMAALVLSACGGGGGSGTDDAAEAERLRRKSSTSTGNTPTTTTTTTTPTTTTPTSTTGTTTPTTGTTTGTTSPTTTTGTTAPTSTTGTTTSTGTTTTGGTSGTVASSTPAAMTEGLDGIWPPPSRNLSSSACSSRLVGTRNTYDVGTGDYSNPGKTYTELTAVPWLSLQAGDVVNIHYRATPYKTRIGLRALGTPTAPVYINGVTDANCNRPAIDGKDAVTATDMATTQFGVSAGLTGTGVITIFRLPTDNRDTYTPGYITIQNLKISGARMTNTYKDHTGAVRPYWDAASAVYAVRVTHLTMENCEITDNGNGVFTNSKGGSAADFSSYLVFRRNKFHLNGNAGRSTEHNFYTQAYRVLFEGNDIGQAYGGSSLKDRSSGTVIRYNRVIASARALDLVETEEEYFQNIQTEPLNDYAWVYGNLIINDFWQPLGMSARPIHWGFDNTDFRARKNTLFFYGNTYINRSNQSNAYYVGVFQIGANDDYQPHPNAAVEASGNIFWNDDGSTEWRFLSNNTNGKIRFRGVNYIPTRRHLDDSLVAGTTTRRYDYTGHTAVEGYAPGINGTTYAPTTGSPVLNRGILGPTFTPTGATAANLKVDREFTAPLGTKARTTNTTSSALGAFEPQ